MSKRIIDTLKHDKPWTKARGLQEVLRKAQVFTIDNAVDYFATESIPDTTITEDVTDIWKMSDYPNCAPPFDVFWMETSLPRAYEGVYREQWRYASATMGSPVYCAGFHEDVSYSRARILCQRMCEEYRT